MIKDKKQLWFDVEERYNTTMKGAAERTARCGLM